MKFSCVKENLNGVLRVLSSMNVKNINLPILKNLLISAQEHGIKLVATNLEIAIKSFVRGKIEEPGEFTVPVKILSEYISLVDAEKIDFELKNNELRISGDNYETRIKGIGAADFPVVPEVERKSVYKISDKLLGEALNKVAFTVSLNELRPEIGGVYFKFEDNTLTVAGTDSFRLAEKKLNLDEKSPNNEVIVPLRTVLELQKIFNIEEEMEGQAEVEIVLGNGQILFCRANTELISRLVEGVYPNYSQIIPKTFLTEAVVPREQLLKTVKTSGLFSKSGIFDITLEFLKDKVVINSNDVNIGAYNSSVSAEVKGNTNKVVLNHRFLLEGLSALTGKNVLVKLIDGVNPVMLEDYFDEKDTASHSGSEAPKPPDYFYLVMPIRQ